MSMMRARVQGHRWVDHPAAAVMKARVPGQWVDRPAAVVMEAREQGRCWIDHPAVAVMEARVQGLHWVDRPISGIMDNKQSLVGSWVGCLDERGALPTADCRSGCGWRKGGTISGWRLREGTTWIERSFFLPPLHPRFRGSPTPRRNSGKWLTSSKFGVEGCISSS
ncbi:hypothetical protein ACOMHN_048912 [Nucella lapillus]